MNRLVQFAKGEIPMSWDLCAGCLEDKACLTALGKQCAKEAVSAFKEVFGEDYFKKYGDSETLFFSLAYLPWNDTPAAARNFFDLYARIQLARKQKGWYRFKQAFAQNPSAESWQHSIIQMELVGFAAQRGYHCELEPKLPTGKKGDVVVETPAGRLFFEVLSIGTSAEFRTAYDFYQQMDIFLLSLWAQHSLAISGQLKFCPEKHEMTNLQNTLVQMAEGLVSAGMSRVIENDYVRLHFLKSDEPLPPRVRGVGTQTDTWARLETRICKKGRQTIGAQNVWFRFDEMSGMWQMTQWANLPLNEKLKTITPFIQHAIQPFEHVSGMILTNAGTWALDDDDKCYEYDGNVALRRCFPGGTHRETIIVGRDKSVHRTIQELGDWYAGEPNWLDWALAYLGKPALSRLIVFNTDTTKQGS